MVDVNVKTVETVWNDRYSNDSIIWTVNCVIPFPANIIGSGRPM